MTAAYFYRLACLTLASFFLVHFALGLLVSVAAPQCVGMASRMRARSAASLLLALRLLPPAISAMVVAAICVPSYLWFEPEFAAERVGLVCLGGALLGLAILVIAWPRALRAVARSLRYSRHCRKTGREAHLTGQASPVSVMDGPAALVALAGIVRPRLVVSREVVSRLSCSQMAAALRHERAHARSHDNLKRLLLLLAPGILPFRSPLSAGFEELEHGWARFTEWAADDCAVDGDRRRSLALASALVQVARLGSAEQPSPLATCLLAQGEDLAARIDRLLHRTPPRRNSRGAVTRLTATVLLLAGAAAVVILQPALLPSAHRLLEYLIR